MELSEVSRTLYKKNLRHTEPFQIVAVLLSGHAEASLGILTSFISLGCNHSLSFW